MNLKDVITRKLTSLTSDGTGLLFKTGLTTYRQTSRSSPLPASDIMGVPDDQRYYVSNAGTAITIPPWATLMRITAKGDELYYDFDPGATALTVPAATIPTGAPDWIGKGGNAGVAVEGVAQIRVRAASDFFIAFWGDK